MKKIRIGIIGCGSIAMNMHLPSLAKIEYVDIAAFSNRTPSKAYDAQKAFGSTDLIVYEDPLDLINDDSLDAVHIYTANNSHATYAIAALKAKKHVMVEKPMAISASEAKAMVDTARKNNKLLTVSYQNRFQADIMAIKKRIDDQQFGDIYFAKAHALRRRGVPTWGSFLDKEIQGGGPLIDVGSHSIDAILWLMDDYDPLYVVGTTYQKLIDQPAGNLWGPWDPSCFEVEDAAFAMIVMKSGKTIIVETSFALNTLDEQNGLFSLSGTRMGVDFKNGCRLNYIENNEKKIELITSEPVDAAFLMMQDWMDAIIHNRDPIIKPEQTAMVNTIIEGIYISARTQKPFYFKG